MEKYVKDAKVDKEEVKRKSCVRRFRLGKTLYISNVEVSFPVVMKMDRNDFIKRDVVANVIDSEEVTFLCGKNTVKEWKTTLDFAEDKL